LDPIHIDFEEYVGGKVFEHHVGSDAVLHLPVLKPMVMITHLNAMGFCHSGGFVERVTDLLDPIHGLKQFRRLPGQDQTFAIQRAHGVKDFLLFVTERQHAMGAGHRQAQLTK
jgi:hypothetical protein